MKGKVLIFVVLLAILSIYYSDPINPDYFPQEIKDSWKARNDLRELPYPNILYTADENTVVVKEDSTELEVPFYKDCVYNNSISLRNFIEAYDSTSVDTIEIFFPEGVYTFNNPILFNNKSNIIIRGAGGRKTKFHFYIEDSLGVEQIETNCFEINNSDNIGIEDVLIYRTNNWQEKTCIFQLKSVQYFN